MWKDGRKGGGRHRASGREGKGCGAKGGQNWTEINEVAGDNEASLLLINDDALHPGEVTEDPIILTNRVCASALEGEGGEGGGGRGKARNGKATRWWQAASNR